MACFTKTQQRNRTNCEFEKYVTTSNFFVLNSLAKSHLNFVCTEYVCDKSENAWVCAKWQWNPLDWCYWIALPASPVVQSSNTVSCVSLSFRTHPCVLAIKLPWSGVTLCFQFVSRLRPPLLPLTSKPFELNLRYLGQRIYKSGKMYWMTFHDLDPRSRLWHRLAKICLSAR